MVTKLETLSEEISKRIHIALYPTEDFSNCHLRPYKEWGEISFQKTALVLGLNPSSADFLKDGIIHDCFIHHFPKKWVGNNQQIIQNFQKKGFIYNKYFKKPYDIFLSQDFVPIWVNKNYLNTKKSLLSEEEYTFLNKFPDTGKYVVFSDLLHYKEKTGKKIEDVMRKDNNLEEKLLNFFEMQLNFFNPIIVLINNAYASHIIHRFLVKELKTEGILHSYIKYRGVPIVFSPLLTGTRAIDDFSFVRLKKEINELLV